jgi:aryl-alcohol dehydrogenase-like predicted oxidoreductase
MTEATSIMTRSFGGTGRRVSVVGLGGEGILRTHGREREASLVIREALTRGISYYDSARAYAGSEAYYGQVWRDLPGERDKVFQTSKSAYRTKREALADLEETLKNLGTDRLDLWQIHDVRTQEDVEAVSARGGALEAFLEAKAQGRTRFIGVTGHHDPMVLTRAIREWPLDAVLLPVNPVEAALGGFMDVALSAARERDMAVIGMKILGSSRYVTPEAGITAEKLLRFALSQPITLAVVGCSNTQEVQTLSTVGRSFETMPPDEQSRLVDLFRPHARRLAFYRGVF